MFYIDLTKYTVISIIYEKRIHNLKLTKKTVIAISTNARRHTYCRKVHCDLLTLITRIRNVTGKHKKTDTHRAPDIHTSTWRPYIEILLKLSENVVSVAIGYHKKIFLKTPSHSLMRNFYLSLTNRDGWLTLFIYGAVLTKAVVCQIRSIV